MSNVTDICVSGDPGWGTACQKPVRARMAGKTASGVMLLRSFAIEEQQQKGPGREMWD